MPNLVIVSTNRNLVERGVYRGLRRGPNFESAPDQCFRVVRKSTPEAWIKCLVSFGNRRDHLEMCTQIGGPWYYYEIQTD